MNALALDRSELRAGGTDLSERRRSGVSHGTIVDLQPTDDMARVSWRDDGAARIGAAVSIEAVASDARLQSAYPGLSAAAGGLATPQIRSIGTVGGNLAQRNRCWYFRNPHLTCLKKGGTDCPARHGNHLYHVIFDLGPCVAPHPSTLGAALHAYDARITTNKRSAVAATDILGDGSNGVADNTLGDDETIVHIDMDVPLAGERAAYRRAISRTYAEWPLVEVVVRAVVAQGRFQLVRVAAGGVAPVPLRFPRVEEALQSGPVEPIAIRRAAALAVEGARPLPQTGYKLKLLPTLIADLLEQVATGA